MSRRLRNYLLAGLIVVLPTVVSVYFLLLMFNFMDSWFRALVTHFWPEAGWSFAGVGALIALSTILLVGWLTSSILGRRVLSLNDWLFSRMPLVRSVYRTVKQIIDAVLQQGSAAFQQVVMLQYPRPGLWALGFVTGRMKGEMANRAQQPLVCVFIPTTPNPTSGVLIFAPEHELILLDMPVEDGIKLVISGGVVVPADVLS